MGGDETAVNAVSGEALPSIEVEEGWRPYVYDDANGQPIVAGTTVIGNPTIGYGRLLTAAHGITQAEGQTFLVHDVTAAFGDVSKLPVFAHLSLPRQAALLDMDFNMGCATLEEFGTFLGLLAKGDYVGAAADLRGTRWHQQVPTRAGRIEQVIETGVWVQAT